MEKIKYILGFMVKSLVIVVKLSASYCIGGKGNVNINFCNI